MYTVAASFLFLGLAALQGVDAWGALGHATVGYVAQNYLSAAAQTWAQDILVDNSTSYLASVASWADTYRSTTAGAFSAPFHYIDAQDSPPSSCNVDYARDCTTAGCSISAIANYTQRVADGRLTADNTQIALKFLIHLLGDITQPLHDEALDVGGNTIIVTFDGYTSDNLHSDWDTYIPEKLIGGYALADAQTWANTLIADIDTGIYQSLAASWISGDSITSSANIITTATKWATDANALVCTVVMPDGVEALQTGDLYPTYYNSVVPTVEMQIAKGGYRLANWLNMIVAANVATRRDIIEEAASDMISRMPEAEYPPLSRRNAAQIAREAYGEGCGCGKHR
ncbi:putative nuclease PA3 [Calycina marina]|uniref:Nuclease PA3 n=1 Tax=Calycina marina TaxID=1763456 RepID=A0A9P7YV12_9HELO|nr:putative nuclease PA3 [Calycina marina]